MTTERFKEIYKNNYWGGISSASGRGSDLDQTYLLRKELSVLFKEFNISSILDIPCGDFNWMKEVNLDKYKYIGADIVEEIVDSNKNLYQKGNISFQQKDLIKDFLPKVDLIIVRDCLVHFSYIDVFEALDNICKTKSKYLLTTTFPDRRHNKDIPTGEWRPLNLHIKPFFLPEPIKIINEGCTEVNKSYTDKSLGLWKIPVVSENLKGVRSKDTMITEPF